MKEESREDVIIETPTQPIIYNPVYWDQENPNNRYANNLFSLKTEIYNCHACPLRDYHKPLPLSNMNKSTLMVVGEQPDDVNFQTVQGKILAELLSSLQVNLDHVYFTSVVKCQDSTDYDLCHHFLVSEAIMVNPLVIIALGYQAGASLMQNDDTNNLHVGSTMRLINGSDIIVTNRLQDVLEDPELQKNLYNHLETAIFQMSQRNSV